MNIKQFKEYYICKETLTTLVDYRNWEEKVDFLEEFTKVFSKDFMETYIEVDEYIWFILYSDYFYISKWFLDFCIKKKLKDQDAEDFYEKQVELWSLVVWNDYPSDEECFNKYLIDKNKKNK